jgi:hypothetical protein
LKKQKEKQNLKFGSTIVAKSAGAPEDITKSSVYAEFVLEPWRWKAVCPA